MSEELPSASAHAVEWEAACPRCGTIAELYAEDLGKVIECFDCDEKFEVYEDP